MYKRFSFLTLFLTGLLSGCITPEQQTAYDRSECAKFGFTAGTDGFADCMMSLSANRQASLQQDMNNQQNRFQQQQLISALTKLTHEKRRHHEEKNENTSYNQAAAPEFDKEGHSSYDAEGRYDGCHGTGCLVESPE